MESKLYGHSQSNSIGMLRGEMSSPCLREAKRSFPLKKDEEGKRGSRGKWMSRGAC
jgi:hypothetical protein